MALVRQVTTAGFRPISKYEYIVPSALKVLIALSEEELCGIGITWCSQSLIHKIAVNRLKITT